MAISIGFFKESCKNHTTFIFAASTEQITFLEKDLQIAKIEFDDEGVYSCVARNSFSEVVDGEIRSWESRLDREVKVKGRLYSLCIAVVLIWGSVSHLVRLTDFLKHKGSS